MIPKTFYKKPKSGVRKSRDSSRSKYHNVSCEYNGFRYRSKLERNRAVDLDMMLCAGEVLGWTRQVPFYLSNANIKYVADFLVRGIGGKVWIEDTKGYETEKFKQTVKLWRAYGWLDLHVLVGGNEGKSYIVRPNSLDLSSD